MREAAATSRRAAARVALGTFGRAVVHGLVVIALSSCSEAVPSAPSAEGARSTPAVPEFPSLAKPAELYLAPAGLYAPIGDLSSRYVLYDDGTFALQFVGSGRSFEYKGRYTRIGSVVTFVWEGWSTAGPWDATGSLAGDSLVVRYNVVMQMIDFIDGTYVHVSGTR